MRVIHRSSKLKILIVEPQLIIATDIYYQLISLGYDVVGVHGFAADAIFNIEQSQPDILFMAIDVRHRQNDLLGVEQLSSAFDIPLILMSTDICATAFNRIKHLPIYAFIAKPFDVASLVRGLNTASERIRFESQRQSKVGL